MGEMIEIGLEGGMGVCVGTGDGHKKKKMEKHFIDIYKLNLEMI